MQVPLPLPLPLPLETVRPLKGPENLRTKARVRPLTLDPRILASFWPPHSSTWLEVGGQTET